MILFPPAKINLGLNVLSKRSDGYHEIETCFVEVPLHDILEIQHSDRFIFKCTGLKIYGNQEDNLCVKAFRLLEIEHNLSPVYIHLRKIIPMGAGLGGGSADATYVLLGLNQLFNLNLTNKQLEEYSAHLGSDCSFFVQSKIQLGRGRGELLEPFNIDLTGMYLKFVHPGIHIGTAESYANVVLDNANSIADILKQPIEVWRDYLKNSFETHLFEAHPFLEEIKAALYDEGAVYASMSGSGSTMFGIYKSKPVGESVFRFP